MTTDETTPVPHRAEIRFWGNPQNEQYVVLCHVDGCGFRSPGGLSSREAGGIQHSHWMHPTWRTAR